MPTIDLVDIIDYVKNYPARATQFTERQAKLAESVKAYVDSKAWNSLLGEETEAEKTITFTAETIGYVKVLSSTDLPSGSIITQFTMTFPTALTANSGTVDFKSTIYADSGGGVLSTAFVEKEASAGHMGMSTDDFVAGALSGTTVINKVASDGGYIRTTSSDGGSTFSGKVTIKYRYVDSPV